MDTKVVIIKLKTGKSVDVEIPIYISAEELIHALYQALKLPGDCPDYVRCDDPVAMLQGGMPVASFGIRDGSVLYL